MIVFQEVLIANSFSTAVLLKPRILNVVTRRICSRIDPAHLTESIPRVFTLDNDLSGSPTPCATLTASHRVPGTLALVSFTNPNDFEPCIQSRLQFLSTDMAILDLRVILFEKPRHIFEPQILMLRTSSSDSCMRSPLHRLKYVSIRSSCLSCASERGCS